MIFSVVSFFVWSCLDMISCSPDQRLYFVEDDFELMILTPPHPMCWYHRCAPLDLVYAELGIKPGGLCMEDRHSTSCAAAPVSLPQASQKCSRKPNTLPNHERHEWCHLHHETVTKGLNSEQKLKHRIGERDKEISFLNTSSFLTKKRGDLGNLQ